MTREEECRVINGWWAQGGGRGGAISVLTGERNMINTEGRITDGAADVPSFNCERVEGGSSSGIISIGGNHLFHIMNC